MFVEQMILTLSTVTSLSLPFLTWKMNREVLTGLLWSLVRGGVEKHVLFKLYKALEVRQC